MPSTRVYFLRTCVLSGYTFLPIFPVCVLSGMLFNLKVSVSRRTMIKMIIVLYVLIYLLYFSNLPASLSLSWLFCQPCLFSCFLARIHFCCFMTSEIKLYI